MLYSIRDLRNAAAHSNCLINKLYKGTHRTSANIIKFVASIDTIGKSMRNSKLSNKFLGDFTTLLYVYSNVIKSEVAKKKRFRQLSECIHGRFRKNEEYFEKNEVIKGAYIFIQKIVDYFASKC